MLGRYMNNDHIPHERILVNDLMAFSAEELVEHAENLAKKIRSGDFEDRGDSSLAVDLHHLMDHLLTIWHLRKVSDSDYSIWGQDKYETNCRRIPRFDDDYELIDTD